MTIFSLYSKKDKKPPEIFIYDNLPNKLRVQIVHIINDAIGEAKQTYSGATYESVWKAYKFIHDALCREYGVFELGKERAYQERVLNFLLRAGTVEECLDTVDLCFRYIDRVIRDDQRYQFETDVKLKPDDAIDELNYRFKENGIGYSYEAGQIIRIDSTITHEEITKPALNLLWSAKFENANEEYLKAHGHYRHGRNKECLNECLKAFESVIKIICKEKGWRIDATGGAKKLVQVCFDNNLIPVYLQSQFTSLQSLMESGVATIRNKIGGHGQGEKAVTADDELTRYALNLTGANIIFLVEQSGIK